MVKDKLHLAAMWFQEEIDLNRLNAHNVGLSAHLDIRFTNRDATGLEATMPVHEHTHQPFGLLHGGATAALAETVGSFASYLTIDPSKYATVGMEINAQHLKGVKEGLITARAEIIHLGGRVHVWEIKVRDEMQNLIAICKLNVMVLKK